MPGKRPGHFESLMHTSHTSGGEGRHFVFTHSSIIEFARCLRFYFLYILGVARRTLLSVREGISRIGGAMLGHFSGMRLLQAPIRSIACNAFPFFPGAACVCSRLRSRTYTHTLFYLFKFIYGYDTGQTGIRDISIKNFSWKKSADKTTTSKSNGV